MMLNSSNKYKKLILVLVCGSVSYSAMSKVYSWRDADGAMHYSQFPRQIVEQNAAQSRASRKQADLEEVVSELSEPDNSNLLDGLEDIVANANTLREQDKILKRRDPQLLVIEQQIAEQQTSQDTQEEVAIAVVASLTAETNDITAVKKRLVQNSFMAGVHKRVYGQTAAETTPASPPQIADPVRTASVNNAIADKAAPEKVPNRFLAGIQNKLKRNNVNQAPALPRELEVAFVDTAAVITPISVSQLKTAAVVPNNTAPVKATNQFLAGIQNKLKRDSVSQSPAIDTASTSTNSVTTKPVSAEPTVHKYEPTNAFLAGIKNKLNRHKIQSLPQDEPVSIASQPQPVNEFVQEDMQNKFLAEINRKLLRARLATKAAQSVAVADDVYLDKINHVGADSDVGLDKNLTKSADKIKAIENEISSSDKSNALKPTTARQVNSTLMLSRLSNSRTGRLPLDVTGTEQLDRQGLDASSQFVHEVNRDTEK